MLYFADGKQFFLFVERGREREREREREGKSGSMTEYLYFSNCEVKTSTVTSPCKKAQLVVIFVEKSHT